MLSNRLMQSVSQGITFLINNAVDINLFAIAGSPTVKGKYNFVIAPGTIVGQISANYAINVGQFPSGSEIKLYANGSIQGRGGLAGHYVGTTPSSGGQGGSCIYADYPNQEFTLINNGEILAGGGGGGAGGSGGNGGNGGNNVAFIYNIDSEAGPISYWMYFQSINDTQLVYNDQFIGDFSGNGNSYAGYFQGTLQGGGTDGGGIFSIGASTGGTPGIGGIGGKGGDGGRGQGYDGNNTVGGSGNLGTDGSIGSGGGGNGGDGGDGTAGGNGGVFGQSGTGGVGTGTNGTSGTAGTTTPGSPGSPGTVPTSAGPSGYYLVKGSSAVTVINNGTLVGLLA